MRDTDKLAKEKFNGNIVETIKYILLNYKGQDMDKFVFEWTPEECEIAAKFIKQRAVENSSKEEVNQILNEENMLEQLNLTKEEVQKAERNPYRAKLGKQFLKLLLVNGGLIALAATLQNININASQNIIEAISTGATSIFTTYMALDIGPDLVKYFKFKKLKKQYEKEKNTVELNVGGKVL